MSDLLTHPYGITSIAISYRWATTLKWRHNGHDGVSNHKLHDCLLNRLFGRRSEKHQSPASLAFVRGIHRSPVNSPHKWLVTRKWFHLVTSSWQGCLLLSHTDDLLSHPYDITTVHLCHICVSKSSTWLRHAGNLTSHPYEITISYHRNELQSFPHGLARMCTHT